MVDWQGVFPAVTTAFREDESLDLEATQANIDWQIRAGAHGLVVLGTVGENGSLDAGEKRAVMQAAKEVVRDRVPLLTGVAETTTRAAAAFARDAEAAGLDGLMVLPGMIYKSTPHETLVHYRAVTAATGLPVMAYNNPVSYGVDITPEMFRELETAATIVAIKESSEDVRRLTDLVNLCGDRYVLFSGVDDLALESLLLGARGWISGLVNAFPEESVALYELAVASRWDEARVIYRWFMPLLHLDTRPTLVQCIKLVAQLAGHGREHVRAPRLVLTGEERAEVIGLTETALATRPDLGRLRTAA
jgi:4-hydroxy-tetrahydrodipicolinate synthase